MARVLLLTTMVMAVYVTSLRAQQSAVYCPWDGVWTLGDFSSQTDSSADKVCFSVASAKTQKEALSHCHRQQAHLLTINGTTRLDLLGKNDVLKFWYGVYVSDGRIRRDKFPMTELEDSSFDFYVRNIPWLRNFSHPEENEPHGTSDCFTMTMNLSCVTSRGLEMETPVGDNAQPATKRKRSAGGDPRSELLDPSRHEDAEMKLRVKRSRGPRTMGSSGSDPAEVKVRVKRQGDEGQKLCQRYAVQSTGCQERLPFVCVKPPLVNNSTLGPIHPLCEAHEVGHLKIDKCFSFGDVKVNYTTAQARCEANDPDGKKTGTLYMSSSGVTSSSFLDRLVLGAMARSLELSQLEQQMRLAWVGRRTGNQEECLALNIGTTDLVSWDCQALLPFHICQRHVSWPDLQNFTLGLRLLERRLQTENIAGSLDQQVWVPSKYTTPPNQALPQLFCLYNASLLTHLQSMTLVKRGIPMAQTPSSREPILQRRKRQTDDILGTVGEAVSSEEVHMQLRNGYSLSEDRVVNFRNMTDYYWCEVNDLQTGQIYRSGRLFVRTRGVEMYAVSIAIDALQYMRWNLVELNLLGEEANGPIRETELSFGNFDYRVLRYRSGPVPNYQCETRLCATVVGTIVDFHFFNKTEALRDVSASGQALRTARELITASFQRLGESSVRFHVDTLQVKSIDICPFTTVYDPVSNKTYKIPDTNLGEVFTSQDMCLSNGQPYVRLECEGNKLYGARWSEFEPTPGCRFDDVETSAVTATLKYISESNISESSVDEVMGETIEAADSIDTFKAVDVVYLADILQQVAGLDRVSVENVKNILGLADVVAGVNQTVLRQSNDLGNATNRILRAIDALGETIPLDDVNNVRVVSKSTGLEVWDLNDVTGDVIVGLELLLEGEEPMQVLAEDDLVSLFASSRPSYTETDAAIFLPGSFIRGIKTDNPGKDLRLSMSVFADTTLFQVGGLQLAPGRFSTTAQLNSKVIAARVTVEGVPVSHLGDRNNVTIVYLPVVKLPSDQEHTRNSTCVFWDFWGAEGRGAWSREGCAYHKTVEGLDVCLCDHLTNFAVLLDVYGQSQLPQAQQLALSVITIIGLSLSIVGLACTVLSFVFIRKLRHGKPQQTLFNMALAMLASWVVFLAGFNRVEDYTGCLVVAALLHYFILASFMWMLMEGLLQYLLFVKVLGAHFEHYLLKTAVPAWGLPLIPVIVILAIDTDLYHGGDQYCWMALTPFYFAFLTPVAIIMAVNIVVYIMVVVNICRRGNVASSSSSGGGKRAVGIRASVACFVALGLSWLFAFLAVEDVRVVFQYLFTITATLQGFLIFLIFTARDPTVRAFWRQALCRCCPGGTTDESSSNLKPKGLPAKSDDGPLTAPQSSSEESGGASSDGQQLKRGRTSTSTSMSITSGSEPEAGVVENYTYEN